MTKNQILINLSSSKNADFGKKDFLAQSPNQQVFSTIWCLEGQVNNGGFQQYFYNSSSETVPFLLNALNEIGATKTAQICQAALECAFPLGLPSDPDVISEMAAHFSEAVEAQLELFDKQFFTYPEDLTELLFQFVQNHPSDFGNLPHAS